MLRFVETLVGVFRCLLPARYWQGTRRGALLSAFFTALLGVAIGLAGLLAAGHRAADQGADLALRAGSPGGGGVAGHDQSAAVQAALQGGILVPFAFFLFTPLGWLADYLFLSAVFRGVALAADAPWGDPILTGIDSLVRTRRAERRARKEAEDRERAEGPVVPDQILECRAFAGEEAEYVVVSSRRKVGWTADTTVVASAVRLRIGKPREVTIEGRLRSCYPLTVIRDLQVDRRLVHYEWPTGGPQLAGGEAESNSRRVDDDRL